MRIQAAIGSAQGRHGPAETQLQRAIALAQGSGALTWQLRAAHDLVLLWRAQSRTSQARELLQRAYDAFSEGFDERDLRAAAGLLAELRQSA